MDLYPIVLFVHIVGVGAVYGDCHEVTGLVRLRRAQTVELVCEIVEADAFLAKVFPVATITILLAGLYMVVTRWGWYNAWVDTIGGVYSPERPGSRRQCPVHAPDPESGPLILSWPSTTRAFRENNAGKQIPVP